jgi:transposase-like protein
MPWKDKTTMEQKIEFICEWLSGKYTITELCRHYEISRPTAYLLIGRYEKSGINEHITAYSLQLMKLLIN